MTPPAPNETVGRYVLVGRLGAGAFGTVYKAYDPQLKRHVALKVPNPGALANPKHAERFLREAQAAAGLSHPNIVSVYDAGRDGDRFYIAAAFIDGRPLADAIPEGGMDPAKAALLVRQLADAVAAAHDAGVVHRDIKPANVLVDAAGRPHLTDFGLAAQADLSKLTNEGAVIGTPHYMAPEQAAGQRGEAKPAADQYALGVVLYELLTGRTPFEGPPASVIYNVIHSSPPPPRAVRPDVPAEVEQVCLKAMAKKPENRFADCRALAAALDRCAAGASGEAGAEPKGGPTDRPARKRWPVVAAAAGLAAVAAGAAVVLSGGNKDKGGADPAAKGGEVAAGQPADGPARKADEPGTPPDHDDPPPVGRAGVLGPKGNFRVTADGVLEATAGVCRFGDPGWADYLLTCEVQLPTEGSKFSVGVRQKNRMNSYSFLYGSNGHTPVGRFLGQPVEGPPVAGPLEPGVWYRVQVSAIKDQLRYTVTDTRKKKKGNRVAVDFTDRGVLAGPVMLGTFIPDKAGPVRFRHIKVVAADGKELWKEGPPDLPGSAAAAPGGGPGEVPPPKAVDRKAVVRGPAKWTRAGDVLTAEGTGGGLSFGDPSWTDYEFAADVRPVSGPPEFNLSVRVSAEPRGAYNFKLGTEGRTADLWVGDGGKGPTESAPRPVRVGEWHRVRLSVVGNRIRGFVGPAGGKDGPPVVTHTGGRLTAGRAGLGIGYPQQSRPGVVQFKSLTVTAPDGKVLWEGLPDLPN